MSATLLEAFVRGGIFVSAAQDLANLIAAQQVSGTGGTVVAYAGTSLTLNAANASTYNGNVISTSSASAVTITLAAGLPAGFNVVVEQAGTGQVTLAASGTTLNAPAGLSTMGQRTMVAAIYEAADTYGVSAPVVGSAINFQTGASYTAVLTDVGNTVDMANASANTFNIPLDSAVLAPVGTKLIVRMGGAGVTTIAMPGGTITKPAARSFSISATGEYAVCTKQSANTWDVVAS
jgi:hypothetical protein